MSGGGPAVRRLADWDRERLLSLADEFGSPLYVTDLRRVRENCVRLREAFPEAHVSYAVKAHAGRAVLEAVREAGVDAECASAGEVERALDAGFPGERVRYTAVNPPDADLDHVVSRWESNPEMTVTVGAADTIDRLRERGFDGRLCLRANPGVGAGHHEKVTTGGHAKFGIPIDRVPDLATDVREEFDLVGVHAHAGSGISGDDLSAHRELVRRMGDLAREVGDLEFVDVGGGFGVPYREDEPPLDLAAVADATREALGEVDARLAVEPGRYVVADAGVLLSEVNTVKETPETTVVGIDAGMTTLLRPAMYDAYHAISNLSRPDADPVSTIVAGPVCETSDVFADGRDLPEPERGDCLALGNAGAYGYEMVSTYNSRPRPPEVVLDADGPRVARRRETLDDVTALERTAPEHIPN
ncbi:MULTISPECIES: diaminopimelate decarboxylase [Haloferax]|uniref:Diaminopimelate decarboxylase n=1 Tax=Haloferax massiliensis TaxID=1476858 RepID=A0A0D6JR82_9EURY|nr:MULTISPECIES: diaminopimelate decarboxylase [Haloferax]MDS0240299.1 diaminopimelate decarboxylase [Haloferax sp. S2CR25]MDS0443420.1 diaminopimelate decarboxylase [Haloferax sp. S2CR25-2]CQR50416.1 Diaminopimelate decarboxylase [Haloferax massiliensis]